MPDNIEFQMRDGVLIKGTLMGNVTSSDIVIMFHSGGYDRREKGVCEVIKTEQGNRKIYYNERGNYEYLSDLLKRDAAILLIDQRNHGKSGKNIDEEKMRSAISSIDQNISDEESQLILDSLKKKCLDKLSFITNEQLQKLIHHPIIKDMSFLEMSEDLEEIIEEMKRHYTNIHLVGTCMGGLVASLYALEHEKNIQSLTLFSPLFTFDSTFLHPDNEFAIHKSKLIAAGNQFRMGNAVEGPKTYQEIAYIRQAFYEQLNKINIPIFCIQGVEDQLVLEKAQENIFRKFKEYHDAHGLSPVYYAEIYPGVHCLYDTIFPSVVEVSNFIYSNIKQNDLIRK